MTTNRTEEVPSVARRAMGSLESAVLDVLWQTDTAVKPGEVLERLSIDPPVSYATVLTILRRLWKKGLVTRERIGKADHYQPARTRDEQTAATMADAFAAAGNPSAALGHFVAQLSADEASALRRILKRR